MNEEDIDQMIIDCRKRADKMTDWQAGFIDNVERWRHLRRPLSQKQIDKLDEIWEQVTKEG